MIKEHKRGYRDYCQTPYPSFRWKKGQMWTCACGNMFKVVSGYDSKDWEFVGVNEGQKSYIRKEPDADDLIERVRLIMRNYSETIDFDTHYELEDKLVNTIQRWSEGNLK